MPQNATEDVRARAWGMYLSGAPKSRIARALALDRETVSRYIRACYAEVADERRMTLARKLDGAVARWRRVQEQAWDDHDADDEREGQVFAVALERASLGAREGSDGASRRAAAHVSVRYRSQRSQYLRIILDAEREIARLEGLYEGALDDGEAVTFTISRRAEE